MPPARPEVTDEFTKKTVALSNQERFLRIIESSVLMGLLLVRPSDKNLLQVCRSIGESTLGGSRLNPALKNRHIIFPER
jgi:hypothetical protein